MTNYLIIFDIYNVRGLRQIIINKGDFKMKILKKVLHLNYSEEKNQKQVVKSYNFEVATNAEDNTLKEVGEELKKLIDKNIDTITTNTKESL